MSEHYWKNEPFPKTLEKCNAVARAANIQHSNSIELAAKTIDALNHGETASCVLVGELQSGKTAAQIVSILSLPVLWPAAANIGVLFITNKALTAIHDQTKIRLEAAGFSKRPFCDHSSDTLWKKESAGVNIWVAAEMISGKCWDDESNSGKLKTAKEKLDAAGCTHFAIVMDEVHISIKSGQQIDRFMKNYLGISVPTNKTDTFKPPTVFIGSTATPHRDFIAPKFSMPLLIVYGKPGTNYYGMEKLRSRMIDLKELSFADLNSILTPLNATNSNKLFVIRINALKKSSSEDAIVNKVAKKLGLKVLSYSAHDKNLHSLPERFTTAPKTGNMIIMIKQGLGAGVTIPTVEHIGAWIDTAYKNEQSLVQSLGRLCGNQENRHRAQFPIYCDVDGVDAYIDKMKKTALGQPLSDNEKIKALGKSVRKSSSSGQWVPNGPVIKWKLGTEKDLKRQPWYGFETRVTHMAKNNVKNVAGDILKGRSSQKIVSPVYPGPSKPSDKKKAREHARSWAALVEKFPKLKNISDDMVFYADNLVFKSAQEINDARLRGNNAFTEN